MATDRIERQRFDRGSNRIAVLLSQLSARGWRYWVVVILLIGIGLNVGPWLAKHRVWIQLRYRVYQTLLSISPRSPYVRNTVIVLVSDDEHWKGELANSAGVSRVR